MLYLFSEFALQKNEIDFFGIARKNFKKYNAKDGGLEGYVRPPKKDELPD